MIISGEIKSGNSERKKYSNSWGDGHDWSHVILLPRRNKKVQSI